MFNRNKPETQLETALDRAFGELKNHDIDSDEYAKILDRTVKLHKMKEEEKPSSVSRDTQAQIAANLAGIGMIILFERENILTSKALNFVGKTR